MKKKICALVILCVVIVFLCIYFPIKKAININEIEPSNNYILVEIQKATVSQWVAINKNGQKISEQMNYSLIGNFPFGFNYGVESASNVYVCFGRDLKQQNTIHGDSYNVFEVDSWEILFPIQRTSLLSKFLPKSYLTLYDYIK